MKQKIKAAFTRKPKTSVSAAKVDDSSAEEPAKKQRLAKLKKLHRLRRKDPAVKIEQAIESLPRITNETVAEHREEMLKGARKFIYPLKHSRKRIIKNTVILASAGIVLFIVFVLVSLYRFQSYSTFIYGITKAIPVPVAKAGDSWVSYESYLFELRHLTHYYETQQNVDFTTKNGKAQLEDQKRKALNQVLEDAYVKQLAAQNGVSVNGKEVDAAVNTLREQNRLGNNDQEFADVLKEFWNWSPADFRRALAQQLLAQKVVAKLDATNRDRAGRAEASLKQPGADFAKIAAQVSDDQASRANGGEYGFEIDANSRDLAPKLVDQLLKMRPNQVSPVIDTGYALEIVKLISNSNGKLRAAHIQFNYQPVSQLTKPLQDKKPPSRYIKLPELLLPQGGPSAGNGPAGANNAGSPAAQ